MLTEDLPTARSHQSNRNIESNPESLESLRDDAKKFALGTFGYNRRIAKKGKAINELLLIRLYRTSCITVLLLMNWIYDRNPIRLQNFR